MRLVVGKWTLSIVSGVPLPDQELSSLFPLIWTIVIFVADVSVMSDDVLSP